MQRTGNGSYTRAITATRLQESAHATGELAAVQGRSIKRVVFGAGCQRATSDASRATARCSVAKCSPSCRCLAGDVSSVLPGGRRLALEGASGGAESRRPHSQPH
jgi:hypothetical protein